MSKNAILQDFTDALWTATDEVGLRSVADRVTSRLGFKRFAYLRLAESQTVWISNYPRSWISRYFEQEYERIDPILINARRQHRAFVWDGQSSQAARTSGLRQFFDEASEFEIKTGMTIPIRSGFGELTALTFATDERASEVGKLISEAGEVIELIGLYFHARVDVTLRGPRADSSARLSQRERECLSWAARGKTVREAGEIMGLAARTVSFHLENARVKLEVSNITHAVAVAIRRGLIQ